MKTVTPEEKYYAAKLVNLGVYKHHIADELGRASTTVYAWFDRSYQQRRNIYFKDKYKNDSEYRQQRLDMMNAWRKTDKGRLTNRNTCGSNRKKTVNIDSHVFFDGQWHEVCPVETKRVFKDILVTAEDKRAYKELSAQCDELFRQTGIKHHVDHIQPLSKGGLHAPENFQILTESENLSKGNTFRLEDQALLCRRLFNYD